MAEVSDCMDSDRETCYSALKRNDARFDGRVFVGVSSTKIYCRLICRAKAPKKENCTFFPSAAAAEAAGYRPCRLCRPELAPGLPASIRPSAAQKVSELVEENCLDDLDLKNLAAALDTTPEELSRAFQEEFGTTLQQYLTTRRLLLAKHLITDTGLPLDEIALYTRQKDANTMDQLFLGHYRAASHTFRNPRKNYPTDPPKVTLKLGYRPPYAWDALLGFLEVRAIPGVEMVKDGAYYRTAGVEHNSNHYKGWLSVRNEPARNRVSLDLSRSLLPVLPKILFKVKKLFDLDSDPEAVFLGLAALEDSGYAARVPGIRVPGCFDPFEISVRAILGQQITVKAARTLAMRFAHNFGIEISTPFEEPNCVFPTPSAITKLELPIENRLGPLGITRMRARSILSLAQAIENSDVCFSPSAAPEDEFKKLLKLPGFGPWTVQYVGMRAFSWPDAFLHTDYGIKKALPGLKDKQILEMAEKWAPWRSYAAFCLWKALDTTTS